MTGVEILVRYRWLMEEAIAISKHADRLIRIGGPAGIKNQALTGMPKGTNDPEAASIQAFDGYVKQLRTKANEIVLICGQFEEILSKISDDRARTICRQYYANGMTDEQIAVRYHMDRSTVTTIRNNALLQL